MIELKPCPFCNGEAEFTTNQGYDKNCYVRCKECSAKARVIDVCVDYAAKEKAAELWNARAGEKLVADSRIFIKCDECGGEIGERYWSHDGSDIANDAYCSERCIYDALGIEDRSNVREG